MSVKVKLISMVSTCVLAIAMLIMGVLAITSQTITLSGEVGFNISDKSVYVKDARTSSGTISGFMPGYVGNGLILSDTTISGSSFVIYLDVINTTTKKFNVITESSQSGVSISTEDYIPANTADLTEITSSTPITTTIALTVSNTTGSAVNLSNIMIQVEEQTYVALDGFVFNNLLSNTGELVSYSGSATNVDIPDTYDTMEVGGETIYIEGDTYTVTAIADGTSSSYAFQNATNMTSVNIPTTVTSIGAYAFYNHSILETVNFPNSLSSIGSYSFYGCSNLNSNFSIPSTLKTISTYAFYNCKKLTSNGLNLSNLTSLGTRAFYNCSSLTGSLTLPTYGGIANYVFYNCSGLTGDLTIHTSTTSIGTGAFDGCSGLDGTLTLPTTVRTIFASAFSGCSSLKSAGLNLSNVRTLENYAFRNCEAITGTLVLPNISTIPQYAFYNCSLSGTLNLPSTVTNVETYAFYGNNFTGKLDLNNVQVIGDRAFGELRNVSTLILPSSIISIGSYAFAYMYGLFTIEYNIPSLSDFSASSYPFYYSGVNGGGIDVTFGANVTRIPSYLFSSSSSLYTRIETVSIPSSVTYIGRYAFRYCSALSTANFASTLGWYVTTSASSDTGTDLSSTNIGNTSTAAQYLRSDYVSYYWKKNPVKVLEGFTFRNLTSNTGELVSYTGADADVEIPKTYSVVDGQFVEGTDYTVTAIADGTYNTGAFYSASSTLASVSIPDTITRIGDYAFANCSKLTTFNLPSGLHTIGDYAFSYSGITGSLIIPNTVTEIGAYAFNSCRSLTSLTLSTNLSTIGNYAFSWCTGFTGTLSLPSSLKSIGGNAFNFCSGFTGSLKIPEGITSISDWTFQSCSGFTGTLTLPSTLKSIGSTAFDSCSGLTGAIVIPEGVTTIGMNAFSSCRKITSITIPSTVTSIAQSAFANCSMLTSVNFNAQVADFTSSANIFASAGLDSTGITFTIGSNVTRVPAYLFNGYAGGNTNTSPNLLNVIISEGVEEIGNHAFYYCNKLKNLSLPITLTLIENEAFRNCVAMSATFNNTTGWKAGSTSLSSSNLGNKLMAAMYLHSSYASYTWQCTIVKLEGFEFDGNTLVSYSGTATNLVIPSSYSRVNGQFVEGDNYTVAAIADGTDYGTGAFYSARNTLESVQLPSTLTKIGAYAFESCSNLQSCNLPSSLKIIGECAFLECSSLTGQLVIPSGVTTIGLGAFAYSSITGALVIPNSVTSLGISAFERCEGVTSVEIGTGVKIIEMSTFYGCSKLSKVVFSSNLMEIGPSVFENCTSLTSATFKTTTGWKAGTTTLSSTSLSNTSTAARYLRSTYVDETWTRS